MFSSCVSKSPSQHTWRADNVFIWEWCKSCKEAKHRHDAILLTADKKESAQSNSFVSNIP